MSKLVKAKVLKDGIVNGRHVCAVGETVLMDDVVAVGHAHRGAVELSIGAGFVLSAAALERRDKLERDEPKTPPEPPTPVVRVVALIPGTVVGRRVVSEAGESVDVPEPAAVDAMLQGRAVLAEGAKLSPKARAEIEKAGHTPEGLAVRAKLAAEAAAKPKPAPPEVRVVSLAPSGLAGNRVVSRVGEEFGLVEADAVVALALGKVALAKGEALSPAGQAELDRLTTARRPIPA